MDISGSSYWQIFAKYATTIPGLSGSTPIQISTSPSVKKYDATHTRTMYAVQDGSSNIQVVWMSYTGDIVRAKISYSNGAVMLSPTVVDTGTLDGISFNSSANQLFISLHDSSGNPAHIRIPSP
jgi:hypothetical protein